MNLFPLLIRYGSFAAAIAGIFAMASVLQTLEAQTPSAIPPPPVTPPEKPYAHSVAGTGIIEALSENVSIGVPAPGLVTQVFVKVDAAVKKGDPLLQLDDRELQAQLVGLRAEVESARAQAAVSAATLTKSRDALARLTGARDVRAFSQDDLSSRQNDVAVATASTAAAESMIAAATARVTQAEMLAARLTVKAPRDGTVLQVNIREGEHAGLTPRAPLLLLGDLSQLQVRIDIDEQNAMRIRPRQRASAYVKGDPTRRLDLQFSRIEPYIIPKVSLTGASTERVDTRVLQVIYTLPLPAGLTLYAGQQMDVFIEEIQEEK